ncbi:hypothetical protein CJF42_24240 [Pseudoalteromonas sp. NBT06-2]|uniref:helix-turn-helix domain-containing protein n=1 Tax=Pseudoalteromonas sp. NBT06-2 TaxID=2025950 RepID=UPI000BA588B2|nr:helix-turn-helix transcriptional regulator [Pseudoalteromonas sp. NBT06-2]PAJ71900.1 hypothetical protein CJF42_24240 [Pseudoalteromonas sp. NBT06-2]
MSNEFYEKLKLVRTAIGLSQNKFSLLVDIPLASYKKYEVGDREISFTALTKITSHPKCSKYALWLITGSTNPASGQIAPGDKSPEEVQEQQVLSDKEYESKFTETVIDSLLLFCHLDWFAPNKEKVNFDDCGKVIFKDLRPVIEQRFKSTALNKQIKSA